LELLTISILLVSSEELHTPILVKLDFEVTNNVVEYEACIIGLHVAMEIGVNNTWVYADSNIIINQIS